MKLKHYILACVILLTCETLFAEENKAGQSLRVEAHLIDGSFLLGVPSVDSIPLQTSFSKMDIPLIQIERIQFDSDCETVVVEMRNSDRISGVSDLKSLELSTVIGRIKIERRYLKELWVDSVILSPHRHEVSFFSENVLRHFHTRAPHLWTIDKNELIGKSVTSRRGDTSLLTYATYFKSFKRVLVRGRIVPPSKTNFRLSVDQINLIFNWECADENHYRNGEQITGTQGHALKPGTLHSIVVQQEDTDAVVFVDDREVYRTKAKLEGTVTVYPAVHSTIAVSDIVIEGEAAPEREIHGHSHSNIY